MNAELNWITIALFIVIFTLGWAIETILEWPRPPRTRFNITPPVILASHLTPDLMSPTTEGQLYFCTTNGKLYRCVHGGWESVQPYFPYET